MNLQELANQIRETPLCDLLQWRGFAIKSEGVTFLVEQAHQPVIEGPQVVPQSPAFLFG